MLKSPIIGYWWHPETPHAAIPGALSQTEGGQLQLDLLRPNSWGVGFQVEALFGEANGAYYTLLRPWVSKSRLRFAQGVATTERWSALVLVEGGHLDWPDLTVKQFSFRVEGLQDWTELSGFTKSMTQTALDSKVGHEFRHEIVEPEMIKHKDVEVSFSSVYAYGMGQWGVNFREDSAITLTSNTPRSLFDWYEQYALPLQRLIQFSTRKLGRIWSIGVTAHEPGERLCDVHGTWAEATDYFSTPLAMDAEVLFHLRNIPGVHREDAMCTWLELYLERQRAMDTFADEHFERGSRPIRHTAFFSAARLIEQLKEKGGYTLRYSEQALVALQTAVMETVPDEECDDILEDIHSLRRRSSRTSMARFLDARHNLLKHIGLTIDDTEALGTLFANTRNCAAHPSSASCKKAAQGIHLYALTAFSTILIDLEVMRILHVDEDHMKTAFERDRRLAYARDLIKDVEGVENTGV